MPFFDDWCNRRERRQHHTKFWQLIEMPEGRALVWDRLCEAVRSHYDTLERIANDIQELGFPEAAAILNERLPRQARARSGELGEILATEIAEELLEFRVPVRRLRYKDGREMALRGDDFIGVAYNDRNELCLLKGEAKSARAIRAAVIADAREMLSRNEGRPTPTSLLFVADRLLDGDADDVALGQLLRREVVRRTIPADRIDHALFALSGNDATDHLVEDLANVDDGRLHTTINLQIDDHPRFVAEVYQEVAALGED